jgi:hypothetical protein
MDASRKLKRAHPSTVLYPRVFLLRDKSIKSFDAKALNSQKIALRIAQHTTHLLLMTCILEVQNSLQFGPSFSQELLKRERPYLISLVSN